MSFTHVEGVDLRELVAEVGTPLYCYSAGAVRDAYRGWRQAFDAAGFAGDRHRTCFAVKANGALALLWELRHAGAGFDVVSAGELERVLAVGAAPEGVVFSGPGKTVEDLDAAVRAGVGLVNLERPDEATTLAGLARAAGRRVGVGLRLNPDLDPGTHPSIATGPGRTKFGLTPAEIDDMLARRDDIQGLDVEAVAVHIGSQISDLTPLVAAAEEARRWAERLRGDGWPLRHIDLGGGLAIPYLADMRVPSPAALAAALAPALAGWDGGLITEPGRVIAGPAGVLLTRVVAVRRRAEVALAVCDAGMNALLRPALYGARHRVVEVEGTDGAQVETFDIVGPLCETGDVLARGVSLAGVQAGALLAVCDVGAYGYVMASEYNAHPRPTQVWVDGDRWTPITPRFGPRQLFAGERLAPWQRAETR